MHSLHLAFSCISSQKLLDAENCDEFNGRHVLAGVYTYKQDEEPKVWDIEDFAKNGQGMKSCPYFAARALLGDADIVFAPYNYLLDPCKLLI